MLLNIFILIIIQDFEEYNLKDNNPVEEFKDNLDHFKSIWNNHTKEYAGLRMHQKNLFAFFRDLRPPLGVGGDDKPAIANKLVKINLSVDADNCVYFNDLLYEVMR